jgi:hypothetical protein
MDKPVVGMDDVGAFMPDNALQFPDRLWIGEGSRVLAFFVGEKCAQALQRGTDAIDFHALIAFKFWRTFLRKRRNSNIVSPCHKLDTKIAYMELFPTNSGWIELCKH